MKLKTIDDSNSERLQAFLFLISFFFFFAFLCLNHSCLRLMSISLFLGISRFKSETLLVKILSPKQKTNQILSATIGKNKFCLFKETASCSFRA